MELSPLKEFPSKAWCRQSLNRLIKKVDAGLPVDGLIGRSRRRPVRSAENIARVEELISSQEDTRGTQSRTTVLGKLSGKLALHALQYDELPSWI